MKKLQAHALYFVLVISLIIAILCGAILLFAYYSSILVHQNDRKIDLLINAQSGIELLMSDSEILMSNEKKDIDLFGEECDSVILYRKPWGLFEVVSAKAHRAGVSKTKVALVGYKPDEDDDMALYMVDQNRPLRLSGSTRLEGTCFLPKAGVERDYVEGLSYTGTRLVYGEVKQSSNRLPELDKELMTSYTQPETGGAEKVFAELAPGDTINVSFSDPALVLTGGDIVIGAQRIVGHVVIQATRSVTVRENASLADVRIHAPVVYFAEGFKGSVQVMATDSVIIGEKCQFLYPSSVGLLKPSNNINEAQIKVGAETVFRGVMFSSQGHYDRSRTRILLEEKTVVLGFLYSDGKIDLKGEVNGSVVCRMFTRKSKSGVSENLLVNATINRNALPKEFVSTALLNLSGKKEVAKWLE